MCVLHANTRLLYTRDSRLERLHFSQKEGEVLAPRGQPYTTLLQEQSREGGGDQGGDFISMVLL